jgi:hypothetical protein
MMQWKIPKNTDKYQWTLHVTEKMRYYGLSEQKVLGVIRRPQRIETGIAENTVAVMLPVGNIRKGTVKPSKWSRNFSENPDEDKWNQEIWVMYQIKTVGSGAKKETSAAPKMNLKLKKLKDVLSNRKKLVIISAWRYPGVSPKNNPIPAEILREIEEMGLK